MLPSRCKEEYSQEYPEMVLTSSQEELLDQDNQDMYSHLSIENIINMPLPETFGSLYEPNNCLIIPPPTGTLPALEDWAGEYNFQLFFNTNSRSVVYSTRLGKLFTNIDTKVPIDFKKVATCEDLMIRALMVYTSSQDCQLPVKRCFTHMTQVDSKQGNGYREHVMRCDHQAALYYCDSQSGRLSVVVPMGVPQAGVETVKILYEFVCKSSCMGGMNRRPVAVIFTLERLSGAVVGRRRLDVRICSCPKRDKKKEEQSAEAPTAHKVKRPLKAQGPVGKRLKKTEQLDTEDDDSVYTLRIRGRDRLVLAATYMHGLQYSHVLCQNRQLTTTEQVLQQEYCSIMMADQ